MIPLPDTVTVIRAGTLDKWGEASEAGRETYRGRVDPKVETVTDQTGREVVTKATILLRGAVQVGAGDLIEWTDAVGVLHTEKPVSVAILRDLGGKPLFTQVKV